MFYRAKQLDDQCRGEKMRNKVVAETRILELLDFNDWQVFNEAGIQTMIMLFQKDAEPSEYLFDMRVLSANPRQEDYLSMLGPSPSDCVVETSPKMIRQSFNGKPLTFSQEDDLLERIAEEKQFFDESEIAQGIVFPQDFLDRKGAEKLQGRFPVGTGIFAFDAEEMKAMHIPSAEKNLLRPYFTSAEILRYFTASTPHRWMIYTDSSFQSAASMMKYPFLKRHLDQFQTVITSSNKPYGLHRARKETFFIGEKIVSLRKCPEGPQFSYSDFPCYVTQTYFVIKTSRWDMKYLTGLLNSRLVAFWLRRRGKMQGHNYQVDKEPLLGIPLPQATTSEQSRISRIVDRILSTKAKDPDADTTPDERRIDELVYKLYGLTPEEIAVVEGAVS